MASIFLALALLVCIWMFLIAPGRSTEQQRHPFEKRTFAHRGLYTEDQRIPENSLPAFDAAVQAGYGIELDVQLTKDKQVVVFHDDTLQRVCGVDARVDALSLEELRRLSLCGTNHRIPLFEDVLQLIDGRVPLIVELKSSGDRLGNCERTRALLRAYKGDYCVESFHPGVVRWFRINAPEVLRGQLSEAYRYSSKSVSAHVALGMSRLLTNCTTRPQFIAYRIGPKCLSVRAAEWMGAMRVSWTARPEHNWHMLKRCTDGIIFEYMRPETRFDTEKSSLEQVMDQIDTELKTGQSTCNSFLSGKEKDNCGKHPTT